MADSLLKYQTMRDFGETPEPRGSVLKRRGHSFVVQKHDATRLHYDFRLELNGVLLSWAVTRGPSLNPSDKRLAVRTEDHPLQYGSFEGVIPSGYGAGTVVLWDTGSWEPEEDPHEGLKKGSLKFKLHGKRLKGSWALVRLKPRPGESRNRENWLLIKHRDDYASETDVATERWITSVASGKTVEQMARAGSAKAYKRAATRATRARGKRPDDADKKLPSKTAAFIAPQLAVLRDEAPPGDEWLHEIKFDGYRIVAVVKAGKVQLFTRNRKDWTDRYVRLASALEKMKLPDAVIDGELVAMNDKGEGSFSLMQAAAENKSIPLVYYAFDLMNLDGVDLRELALADRKSRLTSLIGKGTETVRYSEHIIGDGSAVAASACQMNMEGVISKRADAPYVSGRTKTWIKSKCIGHDEFVIGGYRRSDKRPRGFRSLLLGEYDGDRLVYRGRVGTGFDDDTLRSLRRQLDGLKRETSPFASVPADARREAVWVKPQLVAQIRYLETTPDGLLRHPSYLGLRDDKAASEASRELSRGGGEKKGPTPAKEPFRKQSTSPRTGDAAKVPGQRLTSPERVLWPDVGTTKLDLANYYDTHAARILPFLKGRPLSIVRCPDGHDKECFFQKHHNASTPDAVETIKIREKNGKSSTYLVIRDRSGLVSAAQISGLELHVWGAREDRIERPERLVFDLDPDEGLDFTAVRKAAAEVRDVLDSVGLKSFPMLTGGKGVHVIAPITRTRSWDEVKTFSRDLARLLAGSAPDRYVAEASKAKREGRIFLDWLRNQRGATAIAPFSPRRRPGAPVATPVSWAELAKARSANAYTMHTIDSRLSALKEDPWNDYGQASRQHLTLAAMDAVAGE